MKTHNSLSPPFRAEVSSYTEPPGQWPAYPQIAYGNLPKQDEKGLLQYVPILRKHRWTILATVGLTVIVAIIASLRTKPEYDALGRIAINRENADALGFKNGIEAVTDDDIDYQLTLDTQTRILESDAITLATAKALELDKDPAFIPAKDKPAEVLAAPTADLRQEAALIGFIHGGLQITQVPKTRILEIRFTNSDPQLAARVVNTLVNVYIEQNFKTRFESAMQTSDWLSKQLSDLQLKVEASQEKLVRYQREHGILGIDEKQNIVTQKLDELNRELTAAEADRIQKEARYRLIANGNAELLSNLDSTSLLSKLHAQEVDLKTQIAQAEVHLGSAHPHILELNNQLKQVQKASQVEVDKLAGRIKSEYLTAAQRESMLRAAMDQQKQQANTLNESAIEYTLLRRDVDSNRQLYEGLLQRLKEASVSAGLRSSNIRIVDPARVPLRPARPDRRRNVMLALAMGLVGGVVLAFVLESLDNTVRTPEQAQLLCGIPSLGIIPGNSPESAIRRLAPMARTALPSREPVTKDKDGDRSEVELASHKRPRSDMAESYRALRTSILLSSSDAPPKVILITSALPQEGKTTTSINTAIVLSQNGSRVLLVDADMRRPSVHRVFGINSRVGLSTLLAGSSSFEDSTLTSSEVPNLTVLPAGPPPPQPAELLHSETMKRLLAQWREQYDHIVIDSPPALSVTDAVLLSVQADSVVLVIRAASTRKAALQRACDLLGQVNAQVMGFVMNGVDVNAADSDNCYYYGSKYGGYGRYSEEDRPRRA
jgi:succinoglycan biosynthesis transport protein ExoP